MATNSTTDTWAPYALALLRIMTGLLFMFHGLQKLLGFPEPPSWGSPVMFDLSWWAAVLEIVGGPLIVLGLFTRPVAFLLSGQMAVAYFYAHAGQNFYPILNRGELAILYCFIFFYLFVAGGGALSLDSLMRRDREPVSA